MVYYFLVHEELSGSQRDGPQKHQHSASGEKIKLPQEMLLPGTAACCETPGGAAVPLETPDFFTTPCKIPLKPLQERKPHKHLSVLR